MHVTDLALVDFRSYRNAVVALPAGVVVFEGKNGRGKTNLAESIAFLSAFSSHRVSSTTPLVRVDEGAPPADRPAGAVIRARVQRGARSHLLELELARGRANRARLNKAKVAPRDLMGVLRTVVFAPEDLAVLRGDPGGRRKFLDETATKLKPHYLGITQEYDKVSRQRAATLKQFGAQVRAGRPLSVEQETILEVWDRKLADLTAEVVVNRLAVVDAMEPLATDIYNQITEDDRLAHLAYRTTLFSEDGETGVDAPDPATRIRVENGVMKEGATLEEAADRADGDTPNGSMADARKFIADNFLAQVRARRPDELRRGVNLVGAHRDELDVSLDGLPVKGYASHGELWSAALMLRLAELEILREDDQAPVLILDDVFAELDTTRRQRLADLVENVQQVIITTAVAADLPRELAGTHFRVWRDEDGWSQVEQAEADSGADSGLETPVAGDPDE